MEFTPRDRWISVLLKLLPQHHVFNKDPRWGYREKKMSLNDLVVDQNNVVATEAS